MDINPYVISQICRRSVGREGHLSGDAIRFAAISYATIDPNRSALDRRERRNGILGCSLV